MKVIKLFLFLIICTPTYSQLLIPLFDIPQKMDVLSDEAEEGTAVTFNNGEGIFFNRNYEKITEKVQEVKAQDIWFAEKGKKGWGRPFRPFRDVDFTERNIMIGCTRDGERLYILNRYIDGDSIKSRIIYKTRNGRSTWKDPQEVVIPGLDLSDPQTTVFMHSDEDVLLLSKLVDTASTMINEDLFLVYKKEDGTWSDLVDLGPNINSKGLEFSPFLTHDKKALYFASDGHDGFGESDIFVSYREEGRWDKWSIPLNLGLPINSSRFESYFVVSDTNQVYFVSDRESLNTNIYFTKATGEYKIANLGLLAGQLFKDGKPVASQKLFVYDSYKDFLEEVVTDENGKFKFSKLAGDQKYSIRLDSTEEGELLGDLLYIVDEKGNLKKRVTFDKTGQMVEMGKKPEKEIVKGVFESKGVAMMNTALVVLDKNNFPIDTIYTNNKGEFSYERIAMDKGFKIIPRDLNVKDESLELFYFDKSGKKSKTFNDGSLETGKGRFVYNKLPVANSVIKVYDLEGNIIETIAVNQDGSFAFKKLNLEEEYRIVIENEGDVEIVDGIIYFTQDGTSSSKRYIVKDGNKVVSIGSGGVEKVFGKYTFDKLPAANTAIVVLDENNIPIDTIYTNIEGMFVYEKLKLDKGIKFLPLEEENPEDLILYLTDKEGAVLSTMNYDKKSKGYILTKNETAATAKKVTTKVEDKTEVKTETKKELTAVPTLNEEILYFGFNEVNLSSSNVVKLKSYLAKLNANSASQATIYGHTDDVGTEATNMRIAQQRADAVKNYLVSKGISVDRISTEAMGESKPALPNDSETNRSKNRRVEVVIK
ncbi:MAG: OmpA family protein [Flavobacteriales bacterium]|nr:OmpA family protein [Flavobacteriales bacterium]